MCVLTINRSLAPISTASKKAFSNLWCLEERSQKHCKAMTRKHKEESIRRRRWCVLCVPEQVMEESASVSADGVSVLQYDSV